MNAKFFGRVYLWRPLASVSDSVSEGTFLEFSVSAGAAEEQSRPAVVVPERVFRRLAREVCRRKGLTC